MEASVTLKKVGKLFRDKTILAGLTFGVEKGSIVAFVGDNDAGKSTLLRVLAGLENPEYGSVFIHGMDIVKRRKDIRHMIGYVSLEPDMDPWLTLEQNMRFNGLLYGIDNSTISNRIAEYSSRLDLFDFLHHPANSVSYGNLKKSMIVRALVHDPTILILDEPTAFMDAQSSRQTWDLLKGLRRAKTVIYVSQKLLEIEQAHDRILVLNKGKVILDGSLDKLLESTLEFHQFQIEFEELPDELYQKLSAIPRVVTPSRMNNIFYFYGRSRKVFFQVLKEAGDALMEDLDIKKLGLRDLMDSEFARKGLD